MGRITDKLIGIFGAGQPIVPIRGEIDIKETVVDVVTSDEERRIKQGQNKFEYGDNFVWARDQWNADRKARNKGYK